VLIFLLCSAAIVSYFMSSYGVIIDKAMIHNVLETDARESAELFTWPLLRHLLLLGFIPSFLLLMTRITYRPWKREVMMRSGVILASAALLGGMVLVDFKEFALFGRENKELRMYVNPTYALYAVTKVMVAKYHPTVREPLKIIAADAHSATPARRTAIILVVGETARAQEFSLNGYGRDTNPELSKSGVFNFTDVQSCGTDTAESLPCMFSHLGKEHYSRNEAKRYENLLDILQRSGIQVVWRDNNSGSKGVSDRVPTENLSDAKDTLLCAGSECFDEILLKGLDEKLRSNKGELLIVLHQKGSHGPSYYKRTPQRFETYLPECTKDNVQDCDPQSIVNAYDNTIVYTDHVLAEVIALLKAQKYSTAMLYLSDHGESLGENNIYLHGLPYAIAPEQQTHIPLIFWASKGFLREEGIDPTLLAKHEHDHLTHDNLFHSMLGLFDIKTEAYHQDLDLFDSARTQHKGSPLLQAAHRAGSKG
jgi:lipid A ethanolaminephosphotransferase